MHFFLKGHVTLLSLKFTHKSEKSKNSSYALQIIRTETKYTSPASGLTYKIMEYLIVS